MWAKIFGIPDPCNYHEGFIRILAIYIKYVQCVILYNVDLVRGRGSEVYPDKQGAFVVFLVL